MAFDIALLRTLHIMGAAAWFGLLVYHLAILMPAVRAAGDAGGKVAFAILQQKRLTKLVPTAAIITVAAGMGLYMQLRIWELPQSSTYVLSVNIGVILGLIGLAIGLLVTLPTALKLAKLGPGPHAAPLLARMGKATHAVLGLVTLAFLAMAFGSNL